MRLWTRLFYGVIDSVLNEKEYLAVSSVYVMVEGLAIERTASRFKDLGLSAKRSLLEFIQRKTSNCR